MKLIKIDFTKCDYIGKDYHRIVYVIRKSWPIYVYKYKRITDKNIHDLKNDSLWVSNLFNMNDKNEFIYSFKHKKFPVNKRDYFQKELFCMSLSTNPYNKVLWKRYAENYKGMVICYRRTDLIKSIECNNMSYLDDPVKYTDEKTQCDDFLKDIIDGVITSVPIDLVFNKTNRWKKENEYRFSIGNVPYDISKTRQGFLLQHLVPRCIYLGKKAKNRIEINDYCIGKNIRLFSVGKND